MSEKESETFSDRELEIMAKAWLCLTDEPKVNYALLARSCGMTNDRSASNAWSKIKKKLTAAGNMNPANEEGADGTTTSKVKPSTTKKRGRKAKGDDDETPSKKGRGIKKEPTPEAEEAVEEDNNDKDVKLEAEDEVEA